MNDGGPAFPREDYQSNQAAGQSGMTMRDYFAGKSDIPFEVARLATVELHGDDSLVGDILRVRAQMRYLEADAMIAERDKDN